MKKLNQEEQKILSKFDGRISELKDWKKKQLKKEIASEIKKAGLCAEEWAEDWQCHYSAEAIFETLQAKMHYADLTEEQVGYISSWKRFKNIFWVLFGFHLLLKGLSSIKTTEDNYFTLFIISTALGLLVALAMVVNVGSHSYLFSKKKAYILFGFLGLWWAGLVGIFVAYFAVQWTYYKSIDKHFSLREKLVAGTLALISLLFIYSFGSAIISTFSILGGHSKSSEQEAVSEWVQVNSPDGELSMIFPSGYKFEESDSPDVVPGYSYLAYTKGDTGTVAYTVKYENYEKPFAKSGIEYLSFEKQDTFLKQLAESLKDDLGAGVSNFSTESGSIGAYRAIRFTGDLSNDKQRGRFEGFIVLVGRTSYTLSTIYNDGSKIDFDRILESFTLRSKPDLKFSSFVQLGASE